MDALAEIRAEWLARARAAGEDIPPPKDRLTYQLILAQDHTQEEADSARHAIGATADHVYTRTIPTLTFA
jgi:hypothetical protein